jgi:hypothetical protein
LRAEIGGRAEKGGLHGALLRRVGHRLIGC